MPENENADYQTVVSKKKTVIFALAVIGLCFLIGKDYMKRYAVSTYLSATIATFNSRDELFVFIGSGTSTLAESKWTSRLRAVMGILPNPEKVKEELLVFHFDGLTVSKSSIASAGISGSPFTFRDEIYWGRGRLRGRIGPNHWRWDGRKFNVIDENQWAEIARQIDGQFKYYSEMNANAGWTETFLSTTGRGTEQSFTVQGSKVRLDVNREHLVEGRSRVRVTLGPITKGRAPEVLADVIEGYKEIGKRDYVKLKETAGEP